MIPINSTTTHLRITSIDEGILRSRYFARCMECNECDDNCCNYGCPVDISEAGRILTYREDLEKKINVPAEEWFLEGTESLIGFPSEEIKRTRVINGKCVFHNINSRGCYLHQFALERGIDPHSIKPMICFLFPLTWEGSCLYVSEFLEELPCKNIGVTILESQIHEMSLYLGEEFIKEVNGLLVADLR